MFFKGKEPLISVCVPVCNTEEVLEGCLKSLAAQTIEVPFEVIVYDDCSPGTDKDGRNSYEIFRRFKKSCSLSAQYFAGEVNKGCIESRRFMVYNARGKYIIHVDSDDELPPNALKSLYELAEKTDADITAGKAEFIIPVPDNPEMQNFRDARKKQTDLVYTGILEGKDIFDTYFLQRKLSGYVWAKMFKKELLLQAYEKIPFTYCVMKEELPFSFFAHYFAKKYAGTDEIVYRYRIEYGITASKTISTLKKWDNFCSGSSVYTVMLSEAHDHPEAYSEETNKILKLRCLNALSECVYVYHNDVAEEIKEDAWKILCQYWGESFVQKAEDFYKKTQQKKEKGID